MVRMHRRVRLKPLTARRTRVQARIAVNGAVRVQIAAVHKPLAANVTDEPLPVRGVSTTVSPQQARRLVRFVTHVARVYDVLHVRLLVRPQRRPRNERLPAEGARERALAGVQPLMQAKAVLVGEGLAADRARKRFRLFVYGSDVVLQMRGGQIGFIADATLVRSQAIVLQHVQLHAVAEVETRPADLALVRLAVAVHGTLVVVEGTTGGEALLTLVAVVLLVVAVVEHVLAKRALRWAHAVAANALELDGRVLCLTVFGQFAPVGKCRVTDYADLFVFGAGMFL